MMCYILQRGWWPEGWKAEARVVCGNVVTAGRAVSGCDFDHSATH